MERAILYYPTIDIPNKEWLRHALLYWDKISSIVPGDGDPMILAKLSSDIEILIKEGEFVPVSPKELFSEEKHRETALQFFDDFIETFESDNFQNLILEEEKTYFEIYTEKGLFSKKKTFESLPNSKVPNSIYEYLVNRDKTFAIKQNSDFVNIETNTALLYMSLLAKYLADINTNPTTIGTDNIGYEKYNFRNVNEENGFPAISIVLNDLLPSPKNNVSLQKILEFKRIRKDNLLNFRKLVWDFQESISEIDSHHDLKELTIRFQENLRLGVADLNSVLSDAAIETSFKSFKSLINLKSPTLLSTVAILANEKLDLVNLPSLYSKIGLVTIGAIELTGNYIDFRNKQRAELRNSPFSYVYLAKKSGLLS